MKKIILVTIVLSLIIPLVGLTQIVLQNPLAHDTFEELITALIRVIFNIALILAPLMIIVGAFYFLTAGGNPQGVETGKKIILYTIIGFIIIMMASGIVALLEHVFEVRQQE